MRTTLIGLSFLLLPVLGLAQSWAERDIMAYGIADYTSRSLGFDTNQTSDWQTEKFGFGGGGDWEVWKHNNGLVVGGSFTRSAAELYARPGNNLQYTWNLYRYKANALYEHRFSSTKAFSPYAGIGGFMIVLWGGNAPAHSGANASGWDVLGGVATSFGIVSRLSSRLSLKTGTLVDSGKASTYGDPTYTASRDLRVEPQVGLVFRFGRVN